MGGLDVPPQGRGPYDRYVRSGQMPSDPRMQGPPPPPGLEPPPTKLDQREASNAYRRMIEAVKAVVRARDTDFQFNKEVWGGVHAIQEEQTALTQEEMRVDQMAQLEQQMLTSDYRLPGTRDDIFDRISEMPRYGANPQDIARLTERHESQSSLVDALEQGRIGMRESLEEATEFAKKGGGFMSAVGRGAVSGAGMHEYRTKLETFRDMVRHSRDRQMAQSYPEAVDVNQYKMLYAPLQGGNLGEAATTLFGGWPGGGSRPVKGVSAEEYGVLLDQVFEEEKKRAFEGLRVGEDSPLVELFGEGAHVAGMAGPFGKAIGTGQKFGRAVAQKAPKSGMLPVTGAAAKAIEKASSGVVSAASLFGMGYNAAQPSQAERIEAEVAPEHREAATEAAKIEAGVITAVTAPAFVLAGSIGQKFAAGGKTPLRQVARGSAGSAAVFPAMGEVIGYATEAAKAGLGEASEDFRRMLELQIVGHSGFELGPIAGMVKSAADRDWRGLADNAKAYGKDFAGGFIGFGALHTFKMFGAVNKAQRIDEELQSVVTDAYMQARREAETLIKDPEVLAQHLKNVDAVYEELRPTSTARRHQAAERELAEKTDVDTAVQERVLAEEMPGTGATVADRRADLERIRHEAEAKAEREDTPANQALAEAAQADVIAGSQPGTPEGRSWAAYGERIRKWVDSGMEGERPGGPTAEGMGVREGRQPIVELEREARAEVKRPELVRDALKAEAQREQAEAAELDKLEQQVTARQAERTAEREAPQRMAEERQRVAAEQAQAIVDPATPEPYERPKTGFWQGRKKATLETSDAVAQDVNRVRLGEAPQNREYARYVDTARHIYPEEPGMAAAQAMYRMLARKDKYETGHRIDTEIARVRREFDQIIERGRYDLFDVWSRGLPTPLVETMRHVPEGLQMLRRMEEWRHVHQPRVAASGGPSVDMLRNLVDFIRMDDSTLVKRMQRMTKHNRRQLNELLGFGPGIREFGLIGGLTKHVVRRLLRPFESPVSKYGGFAVKAGMMQAAMRKQMGDLRTMVKELFIENGFAEHTLLSRLGLEGKRPTEADPVESRQFNPKDPDHQITALVEALGPGPKMDTGALKGHPENVQKVAKGLWNLTQNMQRMLVEVDPVYHRMRQQLNAVEKLGAERTQDLANQQFRLDTAEKQLVQFPELGSLYAERTKLKKERDRLANARGKEKKEGNDENVEILTEQIAELDARRAKTGQRIEATGRKLGVTLPEQVSPLVSAAKGDVSRAMNQAEAIRNAMENRRNSWGIGDRGYMHHIPIVEIMDGADWWRASSVTGGPEQAPRSVSTGPVKRREYKIEQQGDRDYSALRSIDTYLRRAVPYVFTQRFLQMHESALWGEYRAPKPMELVAGFKTRQQGEYSETLEWSGLVIASKDHQAFVVDNYTGIEGKVVLDRSTGSLHAGNAIPPKLAKQIAKAKQRKVAARAAQQRQPPAAADTYHLLYRGKKPTAEELADPELVAVNTKVGKWRLVNPQDARFQVRVQEGGFMRKAIPDNVSSMEKYLQTLSHSWRRAFGKADPLEWMGFKDIGERWDKATRRMALMFSADKLGWWNIPSAVGAGYGAQFLNWNVLGLPRTISSMRHWYELEHRLQRAEATGDPGVDMMIRGVEGSSAEAFRTELGQRMRDGKNELYDDMMQAMVETGVLSNTRSVDFFERIDMWKPALEVEKGTTELGVPFEKALRKHYAAKPGTAKEALSHRMWQAVNKGYAPFDTFERAVRAPLFGEIYLAARRQGKTDAEARELGFNAVLHNHGIFNTAIRNSFFNAGPGMMFGSLKGWVAQRVGAFGRMPFPLKLREFGLVQVAMMVAGGWGLDWLRVLGVPTDQDAEEYIGKWQAQDVSHSVGFPMRDIPIVGEWMNNAIMTSKPMRELTRFLGGSEMMPFGLTLPNFMATPDSPFVDAIRRVETGAEKGLVKGAAEAIWKQALDLAIPNTFEWTRKSWDTEERVPGKPEEGYVYQPLHGGRPQILRSKGISEMWRWLLPGVPAIYARRWEVLSREHHVAREKEKAEKRQTEAIVDIEREKILLGRQIRFAKKRGDDAALNRLRSRSEALKERRKEHVGALKEMQAWPTDARGEFERDVALEQRAKLEDAGLRGVGKAIGGAKRKRDKIEVMIRALEDDHAPLTRGQVETLESVVVPRTQTYLSWIGEDATVIDLLDRYEKARAKRLKRNKK